MNYDIICVMILQDTVDLVFTKLWVSWFFFFFLIWQQLWADLQPSSWSQSLPLRLVFIIRRGFSACYKRLISLHPGCQGCLNFPKLSPTAFLSAPAKKAITKIAAFFFSSVCLPLLFSLHRSSLRRLLVAARENKERRFNTKQILISYHRVFLRLFSPVSALSVLALVGRSRYTVVLLLSLFFFCQ